MGLRDQNFKLVYDSSSCSIVEDFLVPALSNSRYYDRGVGYFSSGWLKEASVGMIRFAENGGTARWVTSPILEKNDWNAIIRGESAKADKTLREILKKNIEDLKTAIDSDTLNVISWLVADEVIEFKIAVPTKRLEGGDFHDKFGIFQDNIGSRVSFSGSYNDSIKGSLNYESIKVFKSWEPVLRTFVKEDSERFEKIWANKNPNLKIYDIPNALRERIIKFRKTEKRPYKHPAKRPYTPRHILPRDYQVASVISWMNNDYKGIFNMATGTGKTISALLCLQEIIKSNNILFVVIVCPYIHLVDQWGDECSNFNIEFIKCYEQSYKWHGTLSDKIKRLSIRKALDLREPSLLCAIASNSTFSSDKFQDLINGISFPLFFLADEVHHLGSKKTSDKLPRNAQFRLGLSATPKRWYDSEGTEILNDYFGGIIHTVDLRQAIYEYEVLCKYNYHIHSVELNDDELDYYVDLSKKIAALFHGQEKNIEFSGDDRLTRLLRERADILNNAEQKLPLLERLLDEQEKLDYTLIYTSPDQLPRVNKILSERDIFFHQITYRETGPERLEILKQFNQGTYKVLTAIKCLDEGVDIPKIRTAYLLASTGNPREFTQRRGRILRKAEGKRYANIIDFVAVPSYNVSKFNFKNNWIEKSILKREFLRLNHFAECAENKNEAILSVYDLAESFNLQDILLGD